MEPNNICPILLTLTSAKKWKTSIKIFLYLDNNIFPWKYHLMHHIERYKYYAHKWKANPYHYSLA